MAAKEEPHGNKWFVRQIVFINQHNKSFKNEKAHIYAQRVQAVSKACQSHANHIYVHSVPWSGDRGS
jgi:hypothetical protein